MTWGGIGQCGIHQFERNLRVSLEVEFIEELFTEHPGRVPVSRLHVHGQDGYQSGIQLPACRLRIVLYLFGKGEVGNIREIGTSLHQSHAEDHDADDPGQSRSIHA